MANEDTIRFPKDEKSKWERLTRPATGATDNFAINRLINQQNVAEGSNMPPPVKVGLRIPPPKGFQVQYQEELEGATRFILTWTCANEILKYTPTYRIYTYAGQAFVSFTAQTPNTPLLDGPLQTPVSTQTPPCEVIVPGTTRRPVVFAIETRLSNGLVSAPEVMPTASAKCAPLERYTRTITAAYTCTLRDRVIAADATAGAYALTLLSVNQLPQGWEYILKKTDASGNNVTVTPADAVQTIDGAATLVLTAASPIARLISNGTIWRKY